MLPPMVERELRIALLRRKSRAQWLRAAWTAGGITFFFLLILGLTANPSKGRTLFYCLFALGCVGVVTRGFGLTADLFSEERRNGTLGLLVLTGLTPMEIFANKLSGALLLTSYSLLGGLPFFAIPFLAGGITAEQFICALVFLANALLFCIGIGLLASVIHREGGQAQTSAFAMAAGLSGIAPLALWSRPMMFGISPIHHDWLTTSPAYAGYLVFANLPPGSTNQFWNCSLVTLCYSMTALVGAATILHRTWRDPVEIVPPVSQGSRFWQKLSWSAHDRHARLKRRLLEQNPFSWLAARDRRPVVLAQAVVIIAAFVCFFVWRGAGYSWVTTRNALLTSVTMHLALNWLIAYAAAKGLAEERQTGGFEVLLTTPLTSQTIVAGENKAVIARFKSVWCLSLILDTGLAATAIKLWDGNVLIAIIYCAVWIGFLMLWLGMALDTAAKAMWIGCWTGRPAYAAIQAMRAHFALLFWIYLLSVGAFGRLRGGLGAMVFFWIFSGIVSAFGQRGVLRDKLTRELRDIAAAAIPARGDKRFKNWNPQQIFPPGRWGYFDLSWPTPRELKIQSSKSKFQKSASSRTTWPRGGF